MPHGDISSNDYYTVHDAISDLEDIEPFRDIKDDNGIHLPASKTISPLGRKLRDSATLYNHVITDKANRNLTNSEAAKNYAEVRLIDAQVEKTKAETRKLNAEAMQSENGSETTAQLRLPTQDQINRTVPQIVEHGERLVRASQNNDMNLPA